jgi:hypothetical protein
MSAQPDNEKRPRPQVEMCSDALILDFLETGTVDRTVRPRHPGVKVPKDLPKDAAGGTADTNQAGPKA